MENVFVHVVIANILEDSTSVCAIMNDIHWYLFVNRYCFSSQYCRHGFVFYYTPLFGANYFFCDGRLGGGGGGGDCFRPVNSFMQKLFWTIFQVVFAYNHLHTTRLAVSLYPLESLDIVDC